MVEDDLFEELEISKGELVEEYRAGELSHKDRSWFEQHFLATPEGRQSQIFAAAFGCLKTAPASVVNIAPPAPARPTIIEKIRALMVQQPWAVATGTAAILIIATVIGLQFRPTSRSSVSIALSNTAITR